METVNDLTGWGGAKLHGGGSGSLRKILLELQERSKNNPSAATIAIAASNSLYPENVTPGYQCNGVTDNVQHNAAIDALPLEGGHIALSEGAYNTIAPIVINPVAKNRVWLVGHGAIISYSGNENAITVNHAGGDQRKRAHIEGPHIKGTGSGAAGVCLECVYSTCLRDLVIEGFSAGYGIHMDLTNNDYSGEQTLVQDVRIVDCDRGIFADAGSVKTSFNETHLERVQVVLQHAGTYAFYLEGDWSRAYIGNVIVHLIRDNTTAFKFLGSCDSLVIMKPGLETAHANTTFFDFSAPGFVGQPLIIHPYDVTATNRYVLKSGGVGQQFFVIDEDNLWHGRVLNQNGNIATAVTATQTRSTLSYTTNCKIGRRALKATCNDAGGTGNSLLNWKPTDWLLPDYTITELRGKWITVGFWAMAPSANDKVQRVVFTDGTSTYYKVIPHDDTFAWYNLTLKVDNSATWVNLQVYSKYTSDADTDDVLVVDGVTIVEGLCCPSYMPAPSTETMIRTAVVTKAHDSDLFDAAGLTDSATIWTQPAGSTLLEARMVLDEQFVASGLTDLDVTLGLAGDDNGLLQFSGNLTSDPVGTIYKTKGAYWNTPGPGGGQYYVHTATDWVAYTTAVGANLDTTSEGQVTFYFTYREA